VSRPHITTISGSHYDFQGAGAFVLLRQPDGQEIQTRQGPIPTSHPGHYTRHNEIPRHGHVVGQISQTPLKSARMEALLAIAEATSLYGNIPQELPICGLAA
jgi:hypothetical protein